MIERLEAYFVKPYKCGVDLIQDAVYSRATVGAKYICQNKEMEGPFSLAQRVRLIAVGVILCIPLINTLAMLILNFPSNDEFHYIDIYSSKFKRQQVLRMVPYSQFLNIGSGKNEVGSDYLEKLLSRATVVRNLSLSYCILPRNFSSLLQRMGYLQSLTLYGDLQSDDPISFDGLPLLKDLGLDDMCSFNQELNFRNLPKLEWLSIRNLTAYNSSLNILNCPNLKRFTMGNVSSLDPANLHLQALPDGIQIRIEDMPGFLLQIFRAPLSTLQELKKVGCGRRLDEIYRAIPEEEKTAADREGYLQFMTGSPLSPMIFQYYM